MSPLSPSAGRLVTGPLVVAALVLAACGSGSSTGSAAGTSPTCGAKKHYTIGISQWDLREPYRSQAHDDFERLVKEYPQFTLSEKDAQGRVDQQVSDLDALLVQKVDLIILYPGDSLGLSAEVTKVHEAGVPLLEVDRSTPDPTKYVALLGGDNKAIAAEQANYLAQNLPANAKVAIITGDLASDAATERQSGAHEGLTSHPGIQIVAEQTADWRADKAQAVVEAIIKAHPDLAGIIYANDEESLGGWQALKAAGKETQVKQVGIDGLRGAANGVQEVIDGKLLATYEYPNGVPQVLDAAHQLLVACTAIDKRTTIATRRIDSSNARSVMAEGTGGS